MSHEFKPRGKLLGNRAAFQQHFSNLPKSSRNCLTDGRRPSPLRMEWRTGTERGCFLITRPTIWLQACKCCPPRIQPALQTNECRITGEGHSHATREWWRDLASIHPQCSSRSQFAGREGGLAWRLVAKEVISIQRQASPGAIRHSLVAV